MPGVEPTLPQGLVGWAKNPHAWFATTAPKSSGVTKEKWSIDVETGLESESSPAVGDADGGERAFDLV